MLAKPQLKISNRSTTALLQRGIERKNVPDAIKRFLDSHASDALFRIFAKNHTAVTPVLGTFAWTLGQVSPGAAPDPNSRYVALSLRKQFSSTQLSPGELDTLSRELPLLLETVRRMRQDGVTLLAGTDIAAILIPGFSLHAKLQEFVAAWVTWGSQAALFSSHNMRQTRKFRNQLPSCQGLCPVPRWPLQNPPLVAIRDSCPVLNA
jgi:hypothetical protein